MRRGRRVDGDPRGRCGTADESRSVALADSTVIPLPHCSDRWYVPLSDSPLLSEKRRVEEGRKMLTRRPEKDILILA